MRRCREFQRIVISLMFILIIGSVSVGYDNQSTFTTELKVQQLQVAGTPHAPIVIDGDANFSTTADNEGWLGDGSVEDPYIIDGLDIDLGGATGHCINISNTRVNFTIRNCNLIGSPVIPDTGIYLDNVWGAELFNNTCINSYTGIQLIDSDFNSISHNNCTNNTWIGIRIGNSDSNNATYNNISHSSVAGVHLWGTSVSNRIGHNTLTDTRDGIADQTNYLNTIHDNNCSNGRHGIYLSQNNFIVSNNTCMNNTQTGITVDTSLEAILTNNTFSGNGDYGIHVLDSRYVTITNNTCINNDYNIMHDNSRYINVTWNVLVSGLTANIYDDYGPSTFDYNYYSDYSGPDGNEDGIGDIPYAFDYDSDPHPLMFPPFAPFWLDQPTDQTIELGEVFRYDLNATSLSPLTWWVNDTLNFIIMDDGVLYSLNPDFGTYDLEIVATNIYGDHITATFTLRVVEHIPPSWLIAPEDQTIQFGEPFDYEVHAIDNVGISMWTLNDTASFSLVSSEVHSGSAAQIQNSTILSPGVYSLNITVYDLSDNSQSAVFTVIVEQETIITPTTTTTTTTSTSPTTSPTPGGVDPMVTLVIGSGIGAVVAAIIFIVILKKK